MTSRDDIYDFRVGHFDCAAVSDGSFTYTSPFFPSPAEMLFANAPSDQLELALAAFGLDAMVWKAITLSYTCLLVITGETRVLVDTGAGRSGPDTGRLIENLSVMGVDPRQIDLVVLTHGHPDHLGGNTDAQATVLFPNADWVMSKAEWDFWMEGEAEAVLPQHSRAMLVECARRNLQPIKERLILTAGEQEIRPGIRVVAVPGHTPGHMVVWVESSEEQLVYISDLALHPLHFAEPEWVLGVDLAPREAAAQRRIIFAKAAAANCRLMGAHLPFPGLGRISAHGAGWRWEAVD